MDLDDTLDEVTDVADGLESSQREEISSSVGLTYYVFREYLYVHPGR